MGYLAKYKRTRQESEQDDIINTPSTSANTSTSIAAIEGSSAVQVQVSEVVPSAKRPKLKATRKNAKKPAAKRKSKAKTPTITEPNNQIDDNNLTPALQHPKIEMETEPASTSSDPENSISAEPPTVESFISLAQYMKNQVRAEKINNDRILALMEKKQNFVKGIEEGTGKNKRGNRSYLRLIIPTEERESIKTINEIAEFTREKFVKNYTNKVMRKINFKDPTLSKRMAQQSAEQRKYLKYYVNMKDVEQAQYHPNMKRTHHAAQPLTPREQEARQKNNEAARRSRAKAKSGQENVLKLAIAMDKRFDDKKIRNAQMRAYCNELLTITNKGAFNFIDEPFFDVLKKINVDCKIPIEEDLETFIQENQLNKRIRTYFKLRKKNTS